MNAVDQVIDFETAELNVRFSARNININREKVVATVQLCAMSRIIYHGYVSFAELASKLPNLLPNAVLGCI